MVESRVDGLITIDLEFVHLHSSPILSVGRDSGCGNGARHQKHYYEGGQEKGPGKTASQYQPTTRWTQRLYTYGPWPAWDSWGSCDRLKVCLYLLLCDSAR